MIDPNFAADRLGFLIFVAITAFVFYLQMFAERRVPLKDMVILVLASFIFLLSSFRGIYIVDRQLGYVRVAMYIVIIYFVYAYIEYLKHKYDLQPPRKRLAEWLKNHWRIIRGRH